MDIPRNPRKHQLYETLTQGSRAKFPKMRTTICSAKPSFFVFLFSRYATGYFLAALSQHGGYWRTRCLSPARAIVLVTFVRLAPRPELIPEIACFRKAKANAISVSSSSMIVWFQCRTTAGINSSFVPPFCTSPSLYKRRYFRSDGG